MAQTFSCGYVRSLLLRLSQSTHPSSLHNSSYLQFKSQFGGKADRFSEKYFTQKLKDFLRFVHKKKWDQTKKNVFLESFSTGNWEKLQDDEKASHTVSDCNICKNNVAYALFPNLKPLEKRTLKDITNITPTSLDKSDEQEAKRLVDDACSKWSENHNTPLPKVLSKIKGTKLVNRLTSDEKKESLRKTQRGIKKSLESTFHEEGKDLFSVLATRQSFSAYDKQRRINYFETKSSAFQRHYEKENPQNYDKELAAVVFNREGLLEHVKALPDGVKLNLTELAHKFRVPDSHNTGNKLVKQFLINGDLDIDRFANKWVSDRVRKRHSKMPGSTGISTPMPRSAIHLKKQLKEDIEAGKITLGRLIEPKCYKKVVINNNGQPIIEEFTVSGRKIPLRDIRHNLNERHMALGVLRNEADITRYLAVWSDHASILSHGYLLLTVKALYTPETFFTNEEIKALRGVEMNVQEVVETPNIYLFATAKDSILEKLTYVETRMEDIMELAVPTHSSGKTITDILRFFHGDHPEIQFECGNSHGGSFPCICGCSVDRFTDTENALRTEIKSLEDRRKKVILGPCGRKGKARPFQKLSKEELEREVSYRSIAIDRIVTKKDELESVLKNDLAGIDRVPALFYKQELRSANDLLLSNYEVSPSEPLHDIKGHISNIWEALGSVLSTRQLEIFSNTLDACYGSKDKVTGADYRASAVLVYHNMKGECLEEIEQLLLTLMMISKLAYQPADDRCPRTVLLTYNITFKHALLVQDIFGKGWSSSKITNNKFYGLYYHSITTHFAHLQRIISLSSLHTENEERTFTSLNSISLNTSSRKLESVRDNSIVRLQAEAALKGTATQNTNWKSKVAKFDGTMSAVPNTVFDLKCNKREMQAHLERIADFLLPGESIWWHEVKETEQIIFHDGEDEPDFRPEGPPLMLYTKYNTQTALKHVSECWDKCIDLHIRLPIKRIHRYDDNGDYIENRTFHEEHIPEEIVATEQNETDIIEVSTDKSTPAGGNEKDILTPDKISPIFPRFLPKYTSTPAFEESSKNLKSTTAKTICKVIGPSPLLSKFDTHHIQFKTTQNAVSQLYCKKHFPTFTNAVTKSHKDAIRWINNWEKNFFLKNNREPKSTDIDSDMEAKNVNKVVILAEKLLRNWKIPIS